MVSVGDVLLLLESVPVAEDVGGASLLLLRGILVVAGTVEVEVAAALPSSDTQSLRAAAVGATTTDCQSVALVVGNHLLLLQPQDLVSFDQSIFPEVFQVHNEYFQEY